MHAPGHNSFTVSVTLKKEILWFSLKVAPTYFMVPASDETIKYLPPLLLHLSNDQRLTVSFLLRCTKKSNLVPELRLNFDCISAVFWLDYFRNTLNIH